MLVYTEYGSDLSSEGNLSDTTTPSTTKTSTID